MPNRLGGRGSGQIDPGLPSLLRLRLLVLVVLVMGRPSTTEAAFTSLCRSSYPDPGAFDTKGQCNDAASNWPAEFQYCTPENWGLQCGACLQTCYFVETEGGKAFLPFQYTLPSVQLFEKTCDVRAVGSKYQNENSLGNYCCKPCKLWRLVTERCGQLTFDADGADQSCFLEQADAQAGLPVLRAQSSLDNTQDAPHWLLIPPTPNRGVEDMRTNVSLFQQAYRLALDPATYLKPLVNKNDGGKACKEAGGGLCVPFDDSLIPGRMGLTNVGFGLNQGSHRSQHQVHIHYAALPTSFRAHILTEARIPPATDPRSSPCTPATGLRFGNKSVSYFGYFFPWDLATAGGGQQAWDFRSLALQQCPPLVATFVKRPDGQLMVTPPPLPLSPPAEGALPLPDPNDFLMSQVSIVIAPGFSLDPATQRPFGHYVLLGSTETNFHAEAMLCTEEDGLHGGWDGPRDCPTTKDGWPKPEPSPPSPPSRRRAAVEGVSTASRLRRPPTADGEALAALLMLGGAL